MQIPIPEIFSACNEQIVYGNHLKGRAIYDKVVAGAGKASDCIRCKQCENTCPQHLQITELLKKASEMFE